MKRLLPFAILGALLGVACVTPQIPLPPPDTDVLELKLVDPDQHSVEIASGPSGHTRSAWIYIINENQQVGIILKGKTDGSFKTPPFEADDGDQITIDYRRGIEWSDPACVVVDYDTASLSPCD